MTVCISVETPIAVSHSIMIQSFNRRHIASRSQTTIGRLMLMSHPRSALFDRQLWCSDWRGLSIPCSAIAPHPCVVLASHSISNRRMGVTSHKGYILPAPRSLLPCSPLNSLSIPSHPRDLRHVSPHFYQLIISDEQCQKISCRSSAEGVAEAFNSPTEPHCLDALSLQRLQLSEDLLGGQGQRRRRTEDIHRAYH